MGGSLPSTARIGQLQGVGALPQQLISNAMTYGGTAMLPSILRAQRVSDALSNVLTHGGENLRSPVALGANLLATALLNSAANKGYGDLTGQTGNAMEQYLNQETALARGGQGAGGGAPPAPAPAAAAAPAAPPAAATGPAGGALAAALAPAVRGQPAPTVTPDQIAMAESRNDPNAVSSAGALGRMQVMPATLANPGFGIAPARDSSDAERTRVGQQYWGAMLNRYGGDPVKAAVAYNWGPGHADRWAASGGNIASLPRETQAYLGRLGLLNAGGGGQAAFAQATPAAAAGVPANAMAPSGAAGGAPGPSTPPAVGQQPPAVQAVPGTSQATPAGVPMQPGLQPEEERQINELNARFQQSGNQLYLQQAIGIAQKAAERARTPVETEKGFYYDQQGQLQAERPMVQQPSGAPGTQVWQRVGDAPTVVNTGAVGGTAGEQRQWVRAPDGSWASVPISLGSGSGGPGGGGAPGQGSLQQQYPYAGMFPAQNGKDRSDLKQSYLKDSVIDAANTITDFRTKAYAVMQHPDPVSIAGLKDLYSRMMTDTVARVQMVKLAEQGYSPFQMLDNFMTTVGGKGNLSPELRADYQRMFDTLAASSRAAAQQRLDVYKGDWVRYQGNRPEELDSLLLPGGAISDTAPAQGAAHAANATPPGFRLQSQSSSEPAPQAAGRPAPPRPHVAPPAVPAAHRPTAPLPSGFRVISVQGAH